MSDRIPNPNNPWRSPSPYGYNMPNKSLYMYSFALNPKEHQPSGTLNFSEINSAQLCLEGLGYASGAHGQPVHIHVYYINYNILRFASGQAGLAYTS